MIYEFYMERMPCTRYTNIEALFRRQYVVFRAIIIGKKTRATWRRGRKETARAYAGHSSPTCVVAVKQ